MNEVQFFIVVLVRLSKTYRGNDLVILGYHVLLIGF